MGALQPSYSELFKGAERLVNADRHIDDVEEIGIEAEKNVGEN